MIYVPRSSQRDDPSGALAAADDPTTDCIATVPEGLSSLATLKALSLRSRVPASVCIDDT